MKYCLMLATLTAFASYGQSQDNRTINFPRSTELVKEIPSKNNVWVFILAGQSNMAGRAFVEPADTIPNKRILSIDKNGQLIYAKEPLHFYEPSLTGLDCGVSFAINLLKQIPDSITILMIPTAVGGSAIEQWLGDSTYRNVKLLTNFYSKVDIAKRYGTIRGVLWHQGESDANPNRIPAYASNLTTLIKLFRGYIGNNSLPILVGELGSYSNDKENWKLINEKINDVARSDRNVYVISTSDFKHKGDNIHFDSEGQRAMGQRMAAKFIGTLK